MLSLVVINFFMDSIHKTIMQLCQTYLDYNEVHSINVHSNHSYTKVTRDPLAPLSYNPLQSNFPTSSAHLRNRLAKAFIYTTHTELFPMYNNPSPQ